MKTGYCYIVRTDSNFRFCNSLYRNALPLLVGSNYFLFLEIDPICPTTPYLDQAGQELKRSTKWWD